MLANRLSVDPATRVLVIEAGGKDSNPWIHKPACAVTDWGLINKP